jgi:hypothetical protein
VKNLLLLLEPDTYLLCTVAPKWHSAVRDGRSTMGRARPRFDVGRLLLQNHYLESVKLVGSIRLLKLRVESHHVKLAVRLLLVVGNLCSTLVQ